MKRLFVIGISVLGKLSVAVFVVLLIVYAIYDTGGSEALLMPFIAIGWVIDWWEKLESGNIRSLTIGQAVLTLGFIGLAIFALIEFLCLFFSAIKHVYFNGK